MSSEAITSVFNDGYIVEMYDAYRADPSSVDESWRQFFRFAEQLGGRGGAAGVSAGTSAESLRTAAGGASLVDAIRAYGYLAVALDPLGTAPPGAPELTPEFHHVTEAALAALPGAALGFPDATAADAIARLRALYSSTIGFEFEHIGSSAERDWLREAVESGTYQQPLTDAESRSLLGRLTEVDTLERFLGRAYQGYKRFSIEGSDALVVILDEIIALAALTGAKQVAIAMAHRGRINVLAHILGKPYATIFDEFEGKHANSAAVDGSGDVKYHMGYEGVREVGGRRVALTLVPNPSHLEFVNPVLEGVARAQQRDGAGSRNEASVVPVCVHGDAAFAGEGIVAETLNLALLAGFRVGGTIHIIVNNQVGFTTDPQDARSTRYSSDPAKGFDIPILHVNGDNAAACVQAVRLAAAYRTTFGKDVLIDLVSYRRHGHNETDEPAFTQPMLYKLVRAHKAPREVWGERLVAAGIVTADDVQRVEHDVMAKLEQIQAGARPDTSGAPAAAKHTDGTPETGVPADVLREINDALLRWPESFRANSRVARTLARRRDALGDARAIDWGHAEALALGSLLREGKSVRLTGQDVERGTFSHRQDVLHDSETGATYIPLQHLADATGTIEVWNSPLSETAVLGFEYGFSVVASDTLVMWEAQYGDFANVAQTIMDQFIAAGRAKWGQESALAMLLPHGYEGGGPEHSSARLERYLQLCAEGNLRVANPSTPAQYFHVLRRQAQDVERRPLILMQPKSLLRMPEAASTLSDLATGSSFHPVIDDAAASGQRERVKRIVFCTGKVYYDLLERRMREPNEAIALVRVEELYPWPHDDVARIVDSYPAIEDVVWAQEEPKNMGAWTFVSPRLRVSTGNAIPVRYIGRPDRASPAEGYSEAHKMEQERIVTEVFTLPQPVQSGRARASAR